MRLRSCFAIHNRLFVLRHKRFELSLSLTRSSSQRDMKVLMWMDRRQRCTRSQLYRRMNTQQLLPRVNPSIYPKNLIAAIHFEGHVWTSYMLSAEYKYLSQGLPCTVKAVPCESSGWRHCTQPWGLVYWLMCIAINQIESSRTSSYQFFQVIKCLSYKGMVTITFLISKYPVRKSGWKQCV